MRYASILKKIFMAVSGLVWVGFVIGHMAGNLLIYSGPKKFNDYAAFLEGTGKLLWLVEAVLIAFLAVHVYLGAKVSLENRRARSRGYAVKESNGRASVASRTMALAGIVILAFTVVHVKTFKFGPRDGADGLWGLVMRTFQDPVMVTWYVLAMLALGLHMSHGFASAFTTLGVVRPELRSRLQALGVAVGWLIAVGFISFPIYAFFFHRG
ncbi:MAG: succinate dehydrogenase cytochrome b subunit [Myxococcales bacterium]|nr:succinate dehydrogenase cytochrome b subunit [Myxococcales bacterium]